MRTLNVVLHSVKPMDGCQERSDGSSELRIVLQHFRSLCGDEGGGLLTDWLEEALGSWAQGRWPWREWAVLIERNDKPKLCGKYK